MAGRKAVLLGLLVRCLFIINVYTNAFSITKPGLIKINVIVQRNSILAMSGESLRNKGEFESTRLYVASSSSIPSAITKKRTGRHPIIRFISGLLELGTNLFPLWVLSFSVMGFQRPETLEWFVPYVTPALTATMVGMGMTLTLDDFKRVLRQWRFVLVGFVAQYLIMPFSAVFAARFFKLPADIASGLILVGCAPGGTASNLVTLIAKADVALSILMTTASTVSTCSQFIF